MLMPSSVPDRTKGRQYATSVLAYALVMLTVVLTAAAIYTFSLIIQRQTALREVSRYNATWLVSQAAMEVSRLTAALVAFGDTGTARDVDEVQLRHDIVINRLKILTDGDQRSFSPGKADLRDTLSEFNAAMTLSTPIIDALRPGSSTTEVYSVFLPLLARLNRLTASMHERGAQLVTVDLQNLENLTSIIAGLLISLILCCFAIILLTRWNYGARLNRDRRVSELQAELVHLSRLTELGQMVSALAHEVNQPLTAMTNYLGVVRRLIAAGNQQGVQQAIQRIAEQADRARQIIQRLRDQVTKREAVRRVESLSETIEEASSLALLGVSQGLKLEIRVDHDAAEAVIDKVQIQQVLLNLMRNAAEAMDGSARRELSVSTTRAGRMVEISVSDTGHGLAESVRARLFEPFVTTKPDGMGVGLSVCRTIIEAHGGLLCAENAVGGGTIFRLTVPGPPGSVSMGRGPCETLPRRAKLQTGHTPEERGP
jgi:C4-dicarboxylate-specific signal transduction histidine kinase